MNGPLISTDRYRNGRRDFLKQVLGLFILPFAAASATGCASANKYSHIKGGMMGANHKTGHLLRGNHVFPEPSSYIDTDIVIAGGGISGLSAKRWLQKNGVEHVMMVELDDRVGGNSVSGVNSVSAYPWAAHYLPIPDTTNTELIEFLVAAGVITGFSTDGLPIYNEYHLCHDPEERLYINGMWQEGLVPTFGIKKEDKEQMSRFFREMERIKTLKGNDGQYCFRIPVDTSSADEECRKLDGISFAAYLAQNSYTSRYLLWYLAYCCKDDYGSDIEQTSAWAGLHYFAARRGQAANAASSAVLTWPEGNAFLMNALQQHAPGNTRTGMLVYKLHTTDAGVEVNCFDVAAGKSVCIRAKKLLLSTPQYVNKHLLNGLADRKALYPLLSYAPWMVANITLSTLPQTQGYPLCWDNVIFGQDSVGYVFANHQNLTKKTEGVITYYLPITTGDPTMVRKAIYGKTYEEWLQQIIKDLGFAHPGIAAHISHVDIWIWGHGMIRPSTGYIWSSERQAAKQPIDNRIFFAHTDLSGISIFEEAFYQGINAAKQMIQTL